MKKAMEKWLNRHQITFSADTANSICNRFGLDGEKVDECIGLCYQLESDKITQAEFTGGLCVLTGKKPEEVMGILKGVRTKIPENPYIVGTQIAKELGIHYDGIQEEIGLQFTDTEQTGTTFYGNTLEEVRAKLVEKRRLFAAKAVPEVTPVTPEVMGVLKGVNQPSGSKKDELAIACYNALANHGIAVHYTILGKMVRRYYKPEITDQQVLSCLSRRKDLFRRLEDYPGAYFLAGKKEGRTYPEIGEVSDPKKD